MKIDIERNAIYKEIEVLIKCSHECREAEKLADLLKSASLEKTFQAKSERETFTVKSSDIFYFESIDNRTFIYCSSNVFEAELKLYEAEQILAGQKFIRVSKSIILNLDKLLSVKAQLNGRYEARLTNGEIIIINRSYVPAFKKSFGL